MLHLTKGNYWESSSYSYFLLLNICVIDLGQQKLEPIIPVFSFSETYNNLQTKQNLLVNPYESRKKKKKI